MKSLSVCYYVVKTLFLQNIIIAIMEFTDRIDEQKRLKEIPTDMEHCRSISMGIII